MSFTNVIRTYGNFIEQPNIIRKVGIPVGLIGGIGGIGALTANDYFKAQPEERQKVLIRDAFVLGGTALATILAAKKFMPLPSIEEAKAGVQFFIKESKKVLEEHAPKVESYKSLMQDLEQLKDKTHLQVADYKNIIAKVKKNPDAEQAKAHLDAIFEKEEDFPGFGTKEERKLLWKKLTQEGDTSTGQEEGEVRKMGNFFTVGGLSVIGGLLGGIVGNKVNGVQDKNATINMVKEGIFQFVANIALCAVGAASAILLMSHKPVAAWLNSKQALGKGLKTLGIGAGLSLGIFGGGFIANALGAKVVNPICDKIQGIQPTPNNQESGKRKIEFWDVILHLDDLPTALALAGMEIVEPFIPLFFAFSGYRTGIGYRNDDPKAAAKPQQPPQQSLPVGAAVSFANNGIMPSYRPSASPYAAFNNSPFYSASPMPNYASPSNYNYNASPYASPFTERSSLLPSLPAQ